MNPNPIFRRLSAILPGLVLVLSLAVSIYDIGGGASFLQNQVFDLYQRLIPRAANEMGPQAVYIDIDAETSKRYGTWPWPRKRVQQLVEAINAKNAGAIIIDAPLAEADPTSTAQLLKLWKSLPGYGNYADMGTAMANLPDPDAELAVTLARTPSVVTFVPGRPAVETITPILHKTSISQTGGEARHHLKNYVNWRASQPLFEKAARGVGASLVDQEPGSIVRTIPTLVTMDGAIYPSATLEALRVARKGAAYSLEVSEPENGFALEFEPGINRVAIIGTPATSRASELRRPSALTAAH